MSYLVLARKWRPKTFDEVVGQATVTRTLRNALASGRIGHAFLLSGPRGVGKTTTARLLAKALNCSRGDGPTPDPCGTCDSCVEVTAGTCLDVQEIDGATHNGVEQVRELRESARYNPARDRFKIWIIDEVHMLSAGAFNALLKTLEEPPPRVKFIFATTEYHKLPDTILSRCQQYEFRVIPARDLVAHLRRVAQSESIRVSDEALARIARAAEGSARDALSLFDQVLSFSGSEVNDEDISALLGLIDRELLVSTSRALADGDNRALLELVDRLSDYGADYRHFARELLLHVRELLLVKLAPDSGALTLALTPEEKAQLAPIADRYDEEDLLRMLDALTKTEAELRWSQDARVTLELALLKLSQMRRLMPFSELVERVERLSGGSAQGAGPAPSRAAAASRATVAQPERPPSRRPAASSAPVTEPERPSSVAPSTAAPESSLLDGMLRLARPSIAQCLRAARLRLEDDTLMLEVPADYETFAQMHADDLRELARQVSGRAFKVKILAAPASEPKAVAGEADRQRLLEQAKSEPAVQEALDLFNGTVLDVRES